MNKFKILFYSAFFFISFKISLNSSAWLLPVQMIRNSNEFIIKSLPMQNVISIMLFATNLVIVDKGSFFCLLILKFVLAVIEYKQTLLLAWYRNLILIEIRRRYTTYSRSNIHSWLKSLEISFFFHK